jgi:hypothetical protein
MDTNRKEKNEPSFFDLLQILLRLETVENTGNVIVIWRQDGKQDSVSQSNGPLGGIILNFLRLVDFSICFTNVEVLTCEKRNGKENQKKGKPNRKNTGKEHRPL